MPIIVQKYGGSSVADVHKIKAVAKKVAMCRRAGNDVVVVVSAMGKTTDELLTLAHQIDSAPPRRELDMLLSTGERITMALLSMAIQKEGCEAISFTGSQSGIITNDRHFDARIIDVRPHRVEDELARGKVVIIAGYQGMSYKREITTLGRGGSDTTALAMAAALGAQHAEIYSDVDGVYSSDPRKVEGARHLPEIGYDEMQHMAAAGAKVLHAKAVEFAKNAKIAIRARAAFGSDRETVVSATGRCAGAVVGANSVARVLFEDPLLDSEFLATLAGLGISPARLESDHGALSLWVATADLPDWESSRATLQNMGAKVEEGLGTVTFVGAVAGESLARFVDVVGPHQQLRVGPLRLQALVRSEHTDAAVQRVHDVLICD